MPGYFILINFIFYFPGNSINCILSHCNLDYMAFDFKPFLKWFGYSRRERRSSFLLLLIMILVIAVRYIVPMKNTGIENLNTSSYSSGSETYYPEKPQTDTTLLVSFDPNKASFGTLKSLGFSEKQAATLISFRQKGGKFRKKSDIGKIYGVDEGMVNRLMPYILIDQNNIYGDENFQVQKKRTDLNKCDSTELEGLPGIGPVLAGRIIKYRKLLGGFVSVNQLREVYGLSDSTFSFISSRVEADSSKISFIYINKATYKELIRHPYFERYDVQSVIKYRDLNGKINEFAELLENKIITGEKTKKIRPYLVFE